MDVIYISILPLLFGWLADRVWGDPVGLPHLVVGYGKLIAFGEKRLNHGKYRLLKGAVLSLSLILSVFFASYFLLKELYSVSIYLRLVISSLAVFYCLAGKTLIQEVRKVFDALDESLDAGRVQVARIVGRDTSALTDQQIKTAALETLSENLSDGVIAPLFWYLLLGLPGMLTYKMINTLDSMIGYKNSRYINFGKVAAYIDDIANYIPARLTALLMLLVSGKLDFFIFTFKQGKKHASPNSGYPEAALAGILDCRFGGANTYFGEIVEKPYIGEHAKQITHSDIVRSVRVNLKTECLMVALVVLLQLFITILFTQINQQ